MKVKTISCLGKVRDGTQLHDEYTNAKHPLERSTKGHNSGVQTDHRCRSGETRQLRQGKLTHINLFTIFSVVQIHILLHCGAGCTHLIIIQLPIEFLYSAVIFQ